MPKGAMTLEKLAGMVQQGFDSMDARFTSLENRVTAIEKRLNAIEARLDSLESEIMAIRRQLAKAVYQYEFDALERRIVVLEGKAGIRAK